MAQPRYQEAPVPNSPVYYEQHNFPQQTGGHAYPPLNSPPSFHSQDSDMSAPNSGYGQQNPLPRYNQNVNSMYQPVPVGNPSPLNPYGNAPQTGGNPRLKTDPRYSAYPAGAHPLSNAVYADSSPSLFDDAAKKEKDSMPASSVGYGRKEGPFKRFSGGFVNGKLGSSDDPLAPTGEVRTGRLGYLDGLKFLAAWVALNGTFFDATVPSTSYSAIQRSSPAYIFRSTNLGISLLILLSGRSLVESLWQLPNSTSSSSSKNQGPSVAWYRTSRAMLTRPFRFILPVLVVAALQWGLGATGKTSKCNQVGMDEPYWSEIRSWAGYCTLVFDLFTVFDYQTIAGQTFGANLWVTPWLFQGSYCAYVIHIMLGNLSSNRYWIYFLLGTFSWFSFSFFTLVTIGVAIADMSVHGQFERIHKLPLPIRLAIQAAVVAIGLVFQWINPLRDNVNYGMSVVNVTGLSQITFCDIIFVTCLLFVVETSPVLQFAVGNVVMKTLGKLAAGMFLLAPAITFTVVPDLAWSMSNSGSSASAITGVTWVTMFLTCFGLAIVFYFLVELPSKVVGEYFAEFVMNWGRVDSTTNAIQQANQKVKAVLKAPVSAPAKLRKATS